MTQEEKQLLLQDICARVPYHPKGHVVNSCNGAQCDEWLTCATFSMFTNVSNNCRLYLRPMSSMTEKEKHELERLIHEKLNRNTGQEDNEWTPWVLYDTTGIKNYVGGERFYFDEMSFIYDWLDVHHFDYRGLIEKGLALEAKEGMYKNY